jgi:hypothetical protein
MFLVTELPELIKLAREFQAATSEDLNYECITVRAAVCFIKRVNLMH